MTLRTLLQRIVTVSCSMIVIGACPVKQTSAQDLDLRDGGRFEERGVHIFDNIYTDKDSEIVVNSSRDHLTLSGVFRSQTTVLGKHVFSEAQMEGRLTIGQGNKLTLLTPKNVQITLPRITNLISGMLESKGGVRVAGRNNGLQAFDGIFSASGVVKGGFEVGKGGKVFESTMLFDGTLDVGSENALMFHEPSEFFPEANVAGDIFIEGGHLSFYSDGASKTLTTQRGRLEGFGTIESTGDFRDVRTTSRTLSLGMHDGVNDLLVRRADVVSGSTLELNLGNRRSSLGNVDLHGGQIVANGGVTFGFEERVFIDESTSKFNRGRLRGTVDASVNSLSHYNLSATGDLTIGKLLEEKSVDLNGSLNVGNHNVKLLSSDVVRLLGNTTLNGGQLTVTTFGDNIERNGLVFGDDSTVSGNGIIFGNILSSNARFIQNGVLNSQSDLDIGDGRALLMTEQQAQFTSNNPIFGGPTISIAGGKLTSVGGGIHLGEGATLRGHGLVDVRVTGDTSSGIFETAGRVIVENGDLLIGDGTSTGIDFDGRISVGSNKLTLRDSFYAKLGELTTINGGQIVAVNGIELSENDEIRGSGLIDGIIRGDGKLTGTSAFDLSDVYPLTVKDRDYLTVLTNQRVALSNDATADINLVGGTLRSTGGFVIDDSVISTGTSLIGSVTGNQFGVNLFATDDVTIGDASRSDGVKLSQTGFNALGAGQFDMTLLDSDGVEADRIFINGGSIRSDSGFIAAGSNAFASGSGVIFGELDPNFELRPNTQIVELTGTAVGDGIATVLSNDTTTIRQLNMQESGRITSVPGKVLAFAGTQSFAGTVDAPVSITGGAEIYANGELTLGDASNRDGFNAEANSFLSVGQHKVTLLDSDFAMIDRVHIAGGEIESKHGFRDGTGSGSIQGFGIIRGDTGSSLPLVATDRLSPTKSLDVGADLVTLLSNSAVHFDDTSVTIVGGTLRSENGFLFQGTQGNSELAGHGFVEGSFYSGDTVTAEGGKLVLGDANNNLGFRSDGNLIVGSNSMVLQDANLAEIGNAMLDGGTLKAENGFNLQNGTSISGQGIIRGAVLGNGTLNGSAQFVANSVDVAHERVTLLSSSSFFNNLNLTSSGGTLHSSTGKIQLVGDGSYTGFGTIDASFTTNSRSTVTITDRSVIGTTAGDVEFNGDLNVLDQFVTLIDRDHVQLGKRTLLLGGRIRSNSTLELEAGGLFSDPDKLVGFGIINASVINNGMVHAIENSPNQYLTFEESVTGIGSYTGNVRFDGEFSPGASPATVSLENMTLTENALLTIELAGLGVGEFDQLDVRGDISIDGILELSLLGDFEPSNGDSWEIIDVDGNLSGQFTGLEEGATFSAINDPTQRFTISYFGGDGNDVVLTSLSSVPEPSSACLLLLGTYALIFKRRRLPS